jgi:isoleucyl-tRNA synthetase
MIDGAFGALDTTLTPELLQEGVARDFNRLVQDLRKTSGLQISDRIVVKYAASDRIAEAVEAHSAYLRNELLAERIERHPSLEGGTKLSLAGEEIWVSVERIVPL